MPKAAKEQADPRHEARADELARQDKVTEALEAHYVQSAQDAKDELERRAYREVHGVTVVEGKP
jgi:hypothetical protein